MPTRRRSKICSLLFIGLASCAGAPLETALEVKDATRKPDGVLVEPPPAMPNAEERGAAQAGVLALRQPITDEQIGDVVRRYVRAFTETDHSAFGELIDADAVLFTDNGRSTPRATIIQTFSQRTAQHSAEYRQIHGDISHIERMNRWSMEDLSAHTEPMRPPEMKMGDVFAHVPLDSKLSMNGDPLFRSTLVVLVRRAADHTLHIAGVAETDTP